MTVSDTRYPTPDLHKFRKDMKKQESSNLKRLKQLIAKDCF